MATKTCTVCKTAKPIDEFGRLTAAKDGHRPTCKLCHRREVRTWRRTQRGRKSVAATNARRRRKKRVVVPLRRRERITMTPAAPHCGHCHNQADIRGTVHCVECGWGDRRIDGRSGRCSACIAWEKGDRPLPDIDAAASMFTAIVERARQDEESARNRQASVVTPTYCDVDGCDEWLFVCGGQYVDAVRQHTEQTEGDLIDTLLLVARIANDSAPTPLAA